MPLITTLEDGVADSQVVPIRLADTEGWLAIDTGAPFTFLFADSDGPEFVENAGTVEIGIESWQMPAYGDEAIGVEMFQGKPIVGVLGLDFFQDVPTALDYPGGRLVRYLDGQLPADDQVLPTVPLSGSEFDRALIDVVIDGIEITLMLDTGAHDTILVASQGQPDDEIAHVQTADGQIWEVSVGQSILSLPGEQPRAVTVMRAPELDYISPELNELDARGLFGMTSLGWRRIVFDFDNGVLRLGENLHWETHSLERFQYIL